MSIDRGATSPLRAVRLTAVLCALAGVSACADSDVMQGASTSGPEIIAIEAPGASRGGPASTSLVARAAADSVCPTHVRDLRTGREFIQSRSDVVMQAPEPGSAMAITKAEASYIRNSISIGDLHANETLTVDCRSMRRLRSEQPGA